MEAKELQIGDWVLLSDTPVCVRAINSIDNQYYIEAERWKLSARNYASVYNPIPLTEDILKANGFEYNANTNDEECENAITSANYPRHFFVLDDGEYVVVLNQNKFDGDEDSGNFIDSIFGGNDTFCGIPLNHVHQLQHALRLCGLDDLADNFKIAD